jgi:hypothetical protein
MTARDLHCFVCFDYEEGATDDLAFIPIFGRTTESTNTELYEKLGSVLNIVAPCDGDIVPSLCVRCCNLLNDIDFHEVKLRENIYDFRTLYQNGVSARRLGVKIKRENDNYWGDIREEDGKTFELICDLDEAAVEELTLASAEIVSREVKRESGEDVENDAEKKADADPNDYSGNENNGKPWLSKPE